MANRKSLHSAATYSRRRVGAHLLCSTALALVLATAARANPQDGRVAAGSATIVQTNPQTLVVNQASQKAIINWRSFSVGQSETTTFNQPSASSIALNRVTGADPSSIMGALNANGQVWLINPNGIAFGKTARIDVAGLLATTIDIADHDFLSGNYRFSGLRNPGTMVSNAGQITVRDTGLAALVAPGVANSGLIQANLGQIQLSSAAAFTVDLYGDGLFNFTLDKQVTQAIKKMDGTKPTAAVANSGQLIANGGRILLTANAASAVVNHAIDMDGYVEATSASVAANGDITLDGGSQGTVQVAGTLDASGTAPGETGGTIRVIGRNVNVAATAKVEAFGASGGTIKIASQGTTSISGAIAANNTRSSGKGGAIETSGHTLSVRGSVNAGRNGSWLLDPYDLTVDSAAANTIDTSLNAGTSVTLTTSASSASGPGTQNYSGYGDILVNASMSWSTSASLTLSAYRNVAVGDSVVIANTGAGALDMRADNTGSGVGAVTFSGSGKINFSGSTGFVSIFYNSADNPAGSVVNATSYKSPTNYEPYVLANSTVSGQLTSYMLVNSVYDLQNIQNNISGNYALGRDIDASMTASWNGGTGFAPIGNEIVQNNTFVSSTAFTGTFNGLGNTITGIVIDRPTQNDDAGLFGISAGTIENVGLVGGAVTGGDRIGALVGYNTGHISHAYATGQVSGGIGSDAGGLVGANDGGTISDSYATGQINGSSDGIFGGLVGAQIDGTITRSYATGKVSGTGGDADVGGLAGGNGGTISQSYAAGAVDGSGGGGARVGGLVGFNDVGGISQSYATGSVNGGGNNNEVGGLVGENSSEGPAAITESYATGAVTGGGSNNDVGGLVGFNNTDGTVSTSYWDTGTTGQSNGCGANSGTCTATGLAAADARTQANYPAFDFASTWYMIDGQTRPFLRSEYSTTIVNPHQLQLIVLNLGASYTLANNMNLNVMLTADANGDYPGMWGSSGFVPIGNSTSQFTGSFDGGGRVINGLTINSTATVGLFGYIGQSGSVANVGLANVNIIGSNDVGGLAGTNDGAIDQSSVSGSVGNINYGDGVGGLVGTNDGTITNSHSSATVTGVNANSVGGLVGYNTFLWPASGNPTQAGSISKSYATGSVTGSGNGYDLGGLVGKNDGNYSYVSTTIDQSYATGAVNGGGVYNNVGGLVGTNEGIIGRSYATGAVSGGALDVGGLVGLMDDPDTNPSLGTTGTISQSYAVGHVTGVATVSDDGSSHSGEGGLVGWYAGTPGSDATTVLNSYWDSQTTGQTVSGGGTGLATTQLKSSLPAGFDSAVWQSDGSINNGYPSLKWQAAGASPPTPTVTALTWRVSDASSTYGTLANFGSVTLSGVAAVDNGLVSGVAKLFSGTTPVSLSPSLSAGTYTEEVVSLSGPSANLYTLSPTGNAFGTLTINPAQLTVAVNYVSRIYGDPNPPFTDVITGFQLGQDSSVLSGLVLSTAATQNSSVGAYAITTSGGTAANYVIANRIDGTLVITPKTLAWSVANATSTYGTTPVLGRASLYGVIGSDNVYGNVELVDVVNPSPTTTVGAYTEVVTGLWGTAASNYTLASVGNFGTLTITQPPEYASFVAQASSPQITSQTLPLAPMGTLGAYQSSGSSSAASSLLARAANALALIGSTHLMIYNPKGSSGDVNPDNTTLFFTIASLLNSNPYKIDKFGFISPTFYTAAYQEQCVALVAAFSTVGGYTPLWKSHLKLTSVNLGSIPFGTPIGTFSSSGGYTGAHSAIFLGTGTVNGVSGFFMFDQYNLFETEQQPLGGSMHGRGNIAKYSPAEIRFMPASHLSQLPQQEGSYYTITASNNSLASAGQ